MALGKTKLESFVPVVRFHGLNTDKAAVLGSTLAVTGASTFTGAVALNGGATLPTSSSLNAPLVTHTPTAQNTTATLTAAQVKTGWITSTSAAAVALTLPSGTDLGAALGAVQGTVHELYIDNTAGANTVTMIAGTNGVLSTAGVDTAGSFGDLTVASGATGLARYTIMFSSATAYAFTRTA